MWQWVWGRLCSSPEFYFDFGTQCVLVHLVAGTDMWLAMFETCPVHGSGSEPAYKGMTFSLSHK